MEQPQAACTGAAILAGVGVGIFSSFDQAVARLARPASTFQPDPASASAHEQVYKRYVATYEALVPVFPAFAPAEGTAA
jgi:xylulokinase